MRLIVTGAAGFIGSAVVREALRRGHVLLALDKLTYAGNTASLEEVENEVGFRFVKADICDRKTIDAAFQEFQPDGLIHLAAESHVDRSIDGPGEFIRTNIEGTYQLLEASRSYCFPQDAEPRPDFRFLHVSTDEVYGDLEEGDGLFTEDTAYEPSSPYSASKAASDHLVRAWGRTYGVPFLLSNCSNNYGPRHFPEKLIPHMILNALSGKSLPVYGDGSQIRDWLYVEDHATALLTIMEKGQVGETYNIGGHNEKKNIEVVEAICDLLEELAPDGLENFTPIDSLAGKRYRDLITLVEDRPGHDRRYAIDAGKIERELGWVPHETFDSGLRKTVEWFLGNPAWWQGVLDGTYRLQRLGGQV